MTDRGSSDPAFARELDERLETLRAGTAYNNYLDTREHVIRMKDVDRRRANETAPSNYWREELRWLDYLFDASPFVIDHLRHHTYTVTGIRPYDYRPGKDATAFARKLEALVNLGGRQPIPESPLLGGFGFELDGARYNIDTLKYYEVLVALDLAAVLPEFEDESTRRLVWEIGPGWGGFAYQFKTLFPNLTYVMIDLPELFLFSGTYLPTVFPDATVVFHDSGDTPDPSHWESADFVFIPSGALHELELPRLDLTLNMVSFQEMTTAQVEGYARKAHELGSRYIYSLNRERSVYNEQLDGVSPALEKYFWCRTVPVLPVSYMKMLEKVKLDSEGRPVTKGGGDLDYKHIVGTPRIEL